MKKESYRSKVRSLRRSNNKVHVANTRSVPRGGLRK